MRVLVSVNALAKGKKTENYEILRWIPLQEGSHACVDIVIRSWKQWRLLFVCRIDLKVTL
jgi:hypothetical protein